MECVSEGQVEGDERVVVERCAGCEEGLFGGGPQGEDIVGLGEGGEAVVKGWVGEGECATAEDGCSSGDFEGECLGDWVGDLGGYGTRDGVIKGEDGEFDCLVC